MPCRKLSLEKAIALPDNTFNLEQASTIDLPRPLTLDYHIERKSQRFLIKTAISLHLADQRFNIKTDDVSETGLSFLVPGRIFTGKGTLLRASFERWQDQTKKVKLDSVPLIVRRMKY